MGTAVGEKLREARERQKWTVQDVSEKTKIRTDHIAALEAGDYDVFSAPVYIRGFVRNYAGALRLDVPQMLALLEEELSHTERFKEPPPLSQRSKGILDYLTLILSRVNWKVALPFLLLGLLVLSGLAGYRAYREAKTQDPLRNLGPGLYEPKQSGELLPLPVRTNR